MFAMRRFIFLLLMISIFSLLPGLRSSARQTGAESTPTQAATSANGTPTATAQPQALILFPQTGQAVQGNVTITGSSDVPGFARAEVYFSYSNDPTQTWFLIGAITQTIAAASLVAWDTTTITDGEYDLRLVVTLQDGSQSIASVKGLRVRNYSPIETSTPTPVTPTATSLPGDTPAPTATLVPTQTPLPPTPTSLPANPAEINNAQIGENALKGALILAGFFALAGVYLMIKKLRYRG